LWLLLIVALGASYGTAKSGTGIASMSVARPDLIMKSIIPVVMAGIIAIYGLVVAALISNDIKSAAVGYTLFRFVSLRCITYYGYPTKWHGQNGTEKIVNPTPTDNIIFSSILLPL